MVDAAAASVGFLLHQHPRHVLGGRVDGLGMGWVLVSQQHEGVQHELRALRVVDAAAAVDAEVVQRPQQPRRGLVPVADLDVRLACVYSSKTSLVSSSSASGVALSILNY